MREMIYFLRLLVVDHPLDDTGRKLLHQLVDVLWIRKVSLQRILHISLLDLIDGQGTQEAHPRSPQNLTPILHLYHHGNKVMRVGNDGHRQSKTLIGKWMNNY